MIDYEFFDLFYKNGSDKKIQIAYGQNIITNSELFGGSFQLEESLCSEENLVFGACEPSCVKFKVGNTFVKMDGTTIDISEYIDGHTENPLTIGRYKVAEDKVTADRLYREITAYDAMYDILNADVADWYNTILPRENSTVTLAQFRHSFMSHFGIEERPVELVNDGMAVRKTIQIVPSSGSEMTSVKGEALSGRDVVQAICEINGCFGHIGRDGKFHYIYLPQAIEGLYPADNLYPDHAPDYLQAQKETGHLYPQDPKGTKVAMGSYISCKYEDYIVRSINSLIIRQEENDVGVPIGSGNNTYIIQGNFLVFGKSTEELRVIGERILSKIRHITYRPYEADCIGNPCFEVGDPIRIPTKQMPVESYVLKRVLTNVQSPRDRYSANGTEYQGENINTTQYSIKQLRGKANILSRTIEENRLTMLDIEKGLETTISVTAAGIRTDLTNTANGLSNRITGNAEGLAAEITRASTAEGNLSTSITATAEGLSADINAETARAGQVETTLSTQIVAIAGQVVLKVDANGRMAIVALNADPSTGTAFRIKADNIDLTAEQAINLLSGGDLNLGSKNITITSNNFSVDSNGNAQFNNITAFSISGNAVNQFNNAVDSSESMRAALRALDLAQVTLNDLTNVIIPYLNNEDERLEQLVAALDARISSLENK